MSTTKQIIIACLVILACLGIYNLVFLETEEFLIKPLFTRQVIQIIDTDLDASYPDASLE